MTENLANGYSSKRSQRELSDEYQQDAVLKDVFSKFQKCLRPCAFDESSLGIERVKKMEEIMNPKKVYLEVYCQKGEIN